jgi:hypothetical protein
MRDTGRRVQAAGNQPAIRQEILREESAQAFPDSRRPFTVGTGQMPGDGIFLHVWCVYHGAGHNSAEFLTRRIDLRWLHLE